MRQRRDYWQNDIREIEHIANFESANLVRDLQGRFHIQCGTESERQQAQDWMLRFLWPSDQPKPSHWPGLTL